MPFLCHYLFRKARRVIKVQIDCRIIVIKETISQYKDEHNYILCKTCNFLVTINNQKNLKIWFILCIVHLT